jgi:uncharacterized protein with ATP-grasp and redox domains
MANFESMYFSQIGLTHVFYLFKAKCGPVADSCGVPTNTLVFRQGVADASQLRPQTV